MTARELFIGSADGTKHLVGFTRMGPATGPFGTVQCADIGAVLLSRTDCAALIVTVDARGQMTAVADCGMLPYPQPSPVFGGFQVG